VALPFPLEPGDYAYRLDLFRGSRSIGLAVSNIDGPTSACPGRSS
jgi:hypothetical protein